MIHINQTSSWPLFSTVTTKTTIHIMKETPTSNKLLSQGGQNFDF